MNPAELGVIYSCRNSGTSNRFVRAPVLCMDRSKLSGDSNSQDNKDQGRVPGDIPSRIAFCHDGKREYGAPVLWPHARKMRCGCKRHPFTVMPIQRLFVVPSSICGSLLNNPTISEAARRSRGEAGKRRMIGRDVRRQRGRRSTPSRGFTVLFS